MATLKQTLLATLAADEDVQTNLAGAVTAQGDWQDIITGLASVLDPKTAANALSIAMRSITDPEERDGRLRIAPASFLRSPRRPVLEGMDMGFSHAS